MKITALVYTVYIFHPVSGECLNASKIEWPFEMKTKQDYEIMKYPRQLENKIKQYYFIKFPDLPAYAKFHINHASDLYQEC